MSGGSRGEKCQGSAIGKSVLEVFQGNLTGKSARESVSMACQKNH